MDEVNRLGALEGAECRAAKQILAREVTAVVHGRTAADEAVQATEATFGGVARAEGVPTHAVRRADLEAGIPAFVLFADAGLAKSRGAARRTLSQGGGYVNGARIAAFDRAIDMDDLADGRVELRFGKKNHVHILLED
jgi:tyrosyl-tRNA synthetase